MNKWACCALLLFLFGCSGKDNLPSGVIPRDKMEKVIWDMIQADQYHREYVIRDSLKKDVRKARYELYEEVFKMHNITKSTFDKSFEYYSTHPKVMREMFDSLSVKGNRRLQDFYKPAIDPADSTVPRKLKPRDNSIIAK
jgi:Domain of unknown function (DUF4296)